METETGGESTTVEGADLKPTSLWEEWRHLTSCMQLLLVF